MANPLNYIADEEKGAAYPHFSLVKLAGKKIKDIYGYISTEFGNPDFQLSKIVFEDGTTSYVGGEHDHPYLEDYDHILSEDLLCSLSDSGEDDE